MLDIVPDCLLVLNLLQLNVFRLLFRNCARLGGRQIFILVNNDFHLHAVVLLLSRSIFFIFQVISRRVFLTAAVNQVNPHFRVEVLLLLLNCGASNRFQFDVLAFNVCLEDLVSDLLEEFFVLKVLSIVCQVEAGHISVFIDDHYAMKLLRDDSRLAIISLDVRVRSLAQLDLVALETWLRLLINLHELITFVEEQTLKLTFLVDILMLVELLKLCFWD